MKKKSLLSISLLSALALVSCGNKKDDDVTPKSTEISYNVKVVDIDGEELLNKNFKTTDSSSLLNDLKNETTVVSEESQYGTYLKSIAGSVIDNNYFIAIYENDESASTGIDGLEINDGDSFTFKVECWNTKLDSTDVLVDKIIYSYAKNQMKTFLENTADYTKVGGYYSQAFGAADFWTFMGLNLMTELNYDANVFNCSSVPASLKAELEAYDITTLSGAQLGKYYYAAKGLGVNLETSFKTTYKAYFDALPNEYLELDEYTYPFTLGISNEFDFTSDNLTSLVTTTYRADTQWGYDGLAWQIASLAELTTLDVSELNAFPIADQGNATSTALLLLPFATMNVNPRTTLYENNGNDLVEILVENYYDEELGFIKYNSAQTTVNESTPQVYTALMAYKAQRDSEEAVKVFA